MEIFLIVAAMTWSAFGFVVLAGAKSAIHEILAAVLFSFAVLFLGVFGIMCRLKEMAQPQPVRPPAAVREDDDWAQHLTVDGQTRR